MKTCSKCHIEKEDSHFKKGRESCNNCLAILRYCRRKGISRSSYLESIKDHEKKILEREREEELARHRRLIRDRVFNRMRKQNTVYCWDCEVEIPCEEIAGEHLIPIGDYFGEKIDRLYGYHSRGGHKVVPYCNFCKMDWDRKYYDRQLREKRKELQIDACERLGIGRGAIAKYPDLINLKITQLFYHRKFKQLNKTT